MSAKTTYVAQFTSVVSGHWVDAAHEPFSTIESATAWIGECMAGNTNRVIKRTITDEVIPMTPKACGFELADGSVAYYAI